MISLKSCLGYVLVSILWGTTNPFIKHAQAASATTPTNASGASTLSTLSISDSKGKPNAFMDMIITLKKSVQNIRVMLPFLLNQIGSIVFYMLLSSEPVSIVM